jgi:hypothetical protein
MALPKQTREIFELLSKGQFICAMGKNERLYDLIAQEDIFKELYQYFQTIGFTLETGNGYFYFSRSNELNSDVEEKLLKFRIYIDILDFFASLDNKIKVGDTFTPAQIAKECQDNAVLRNKLKMMNTKRDDNQINTIRDIAKQLEKDTFIEKIDEEEEKYKVLDSYHYLEELMMRITIFEDNQQK